MQDIIIHTDILTILGKQVRGEALTSEEHARLHEWMNDSVHNKPLAAKIMNDKILMEDLKQRSSLNHKVAWNNIASRITIDQKHTTGVYQAGFLRRWGWAAALLILFAGGVIYFLKQDAPKNDLAVIEKTPKSNVLPGREGAVLTLADGRTIVLDSLENGMVAMQNGSQVVLKNGQLAYDPAGRPSGEIMYNTMTIPKGRQFKIVLPDGTKVWLNSASSIKYPTIFSGQNRIVEITGEVYFEVVTNARMPFKVKLNEQTEIDVLGTHFNVNAYIDEPSINTTLLEGAVSVNAYKYAQVLRPGQQSRIKGQSVSVVNNIDQDQVMAWKNGVFNFKNTDLPVAMRQIERWYDITVKYEGQAPEIQFQGKLDRGVNLSDVVSMFAKMGVNCRLEEKTLVVEGK